MASQHESHETDSSKDDRQQQPKGKERDVISPEEIGQYRATAQQKSIDAIKAAEQRYVNAKQSGSAALQDTKEAVAHGLGATTTYLSAKSAQAKDSTAHGARAAVKHTSEKGKQGYKLAKDTSLTAAQRTAELAKQVEEKTKHSSMSAADAVAGFAKQVAVKAKDSTLSTGETALGHAKQATEKAMEKVAEAKSKTGESTRQESSEAKGQLGEEAEKAKQQMSKLSIGDEGEQLNEIEKGGTGKGAELHEEKIVCREQRKGPEEQLSSEGGGQEKHGKEESEPGAGELLEAVGETVIGFVKGAKEMVMGKRSE
ncbi:hypothetical protein HPP92_008552 [Vanilla planifolia]|uniref:Uncharacterized protein n=1 Tax=Vanilla planifolia TaxID=51239 RepID=A0A835V5S6_VANPL|nr:hypothetical protein HPP92_008552 [Vanilla planifolia]